MGLWSGAHGGQVVGIVVLTLGTFKTLDVGVCVCRRVEAAGLRQLASERLACKGGLGLAPGNSDFGELPPLPNG